MFKKTCVFILLVSFCPSWGDEGKAEKSGYRYIIENYFSKRRGAYQDYSKSFTLVMGTPFYRESREKSFDAFSAVMFGFNQRIREIAYLGDLNLQVAMFSSKLATRRATLLEVSPRISIPEVQTAFPLYIGLGLGLGFYPRYIIKKLPPFSVNNQFFIGLRFFEIYHNLGFSAEINLRMHYLFSELEIYLETFAQMGLILNF